MEPGSPSINSYVTLQNLSSMFHFCDDWLGKLIKNWNGIRKIVLLETIEQTIATSRNTPLITFWQKHHEGINLFSKLWGKPSLDEVMYPPQKTDDNDVAIAKIALLKIDPACDPVWKKQIEILEQIYRLQFHPNQRCPITLQPMNDPVCLQGNNGVLQFFERNDLEEWIRRRHTNPINLAPTRVWDIQEPKPQRDLHHNFRQFLQD